MTKRLLHVMRNLLIVVMAIMGNGALAADEVVEPDSDQTSFFRIGTSPAGESHFLIGGILANAISNPIGSRACAKGGSCGVPGLIAAAQSTGGSIDNLTGLQTGALDAALVQADLGIDAFQGTGFFKGKPPMAGLRTLAFLYNDTVQVVIRKESGLRNLIDLKGRRISIGEKNSDVFHTAAALLNSVGISDKNTRFFTMPVDQAIIALEQADLDAVFLVEGYPVRAIALLNEKIGLSLLPISDKEWYIFQKSMPCFTRSFIPGGTYAGIDEPVDSIQIGVYLMGMDTMNDELVCGIAQALHHPSTRSVLENAHWRGKAVFPDNEINDFPIPPYAALARCSTKKTAQEK